MSHVCLQFGQCGNQLGSELYSVLDRDIHLSETGVSAKDNQDYRNKSESKWFHRKKVGKLVARAVLVDTEDKVIESVQHKRSSSTNWKYDKRCIVTHRSGGAANNWALGYKVKGPLIRELVIDLVRKQSEKCHKLESLLFLSSSAGGTGSGVGSYLAEQLLNEFPNKNMINIVILPYRAGEVVTQNFNTLFTLSKLYETSDAMFLIENDSLHKIADTQLKLPHVALSDLNKVLAHHIASVFQPVREVENITDKILNITAHSSYKLLLIKTSPFVAATSDMFEPAPLWTAVKKSLYRTIKQQPDAKPKSFNVNCEFQMPKSVGNLQFFRGTGAGNNEVKGENILKSSNFYPDWVPIEKSCLMFSENRKLLNHKRLGTLVTNNSSIWPVLDNFVSKSWGTFIHNAYIHQYSKYGIEKEDFLEMFLKTEKIVKSYKDL